jgi:pyruvate dehydrogenase complex dehydrogenase (E1) component
MILPLPRAYLGDGEMDEPESTGAISLAGREKLDNLIWVVNIFLNMCLINRHDWTKTH